MAEKPKDYLAIILIGAGSSHGRGPTKEEAIKRCLVYLRDWEHLYKVDDVTVTINVIDVTGYDKIVWGVTGIVGVVEATGEEETIDRPFEPVEVYVPARRKRRKA